MHSKRNLFFATFLMSASLTGCDTNIQQQTTNKPELKNAQQAKQSQQVLFLNLVDSYFKDLLKLEPIYATYVDVHEHNDKFGDYLSDDYLKQRHNLNKSYLEKVNKLNRDKLPANLQLSYDLFQYDREMALVAESFPERFLPINQFYNIVFTFIQLGSGESAQPFNTVKDYENWLKRVGGFEIWVDRAIERMNEGIESKVVLPRVLVEQIIPQFDAHLVNDPTKSIFYKPVTQFPDEFSDEEKQSLTTAYEQMIQFKILPAISKIKRYMQIDYLPNSRGTDGWWGLPNGKLWYQQLANEHTTTNISVDEIHKLGIKEVNRILDEMHKVKAQVGFEGDLKAFFIHLSSEPKYFYTNKQDIVDGYTALKDEINQHLVNYFNIQPKADYVVKPVEAYREQSAAGASYQSPAVDGSRPGIFYINTYDLKAQPKWGMTTLSLHEAAPGHHFQIAIKQELTDIPDFQRFSSYTAFTEGWALYAEHLGVEMGLFSDPYQYFGKLSDEMLRAIRLVVDTGLHAKGWTREHAIQYMKDNSPMAESAIIAEVERYMAIPGQALSYKMGQLKILELRQKAEKELKQEFDIKEFHDQLLTSGALPLRVMEQKIDAWIKSKSI